MKNSSNVIRSIRSFFNNFSKRSWGRVENNNSNDKKETVNQFRFAGPASEKKNK